MLSQVEEESAEQKIKDAARELFATHGLKGTTIRKVAEKAKVNVALVNYYFRSKDKLFLSIFEEKFRDYANQGSNIFNDTTKSLFDRIEEFVDAVFQELLNDPGLPIFLISETHHDPALLDSISEVSKMESFQRERELQRVLDMEYEAGNIRKVTSMEFDTALVSMTVFPVISKTITSKTGRIHAFGFDSFDQYIDQWKKTVIEMMIAFLKPR